jgi:D-alanine-D-alanine ligase
MKVAIIFNKNRTGVINQFGMQNKEKYNPRTVRRIADALEQGGHNVRIIDGNMRVIESLHEFMPRVLEGERMALVFNLAYGIQGESRYTHVPAMLEMLGIPYVGSGPEGHALALDKVITKIIMQKHGISTPDFWVFSTAVEDMSEVRYPVIVKPKMEAVSYGLKIVNNENDLREAARFIINEFQQQALVEQFIRGREFCVGLLGNDNLEAFPLLEIDLEGDPDGIQTAGDKLRKLREKVCPALVSKNLADEMVRLSKKAFRVLGLRDFARVDIRMDENENIYLLEINSMASLGLSGAYVNAAQVAGYDYMRLVNKMLDVAAVRYFSESFLAEETTEIKKTAKKPSLSVRIQGLVRSRQERTEKLLKKMVNMNTYVRNVEGVNALGSLIWQNLSALNFNQQVIPQVEVGNILLFSNVSDNQYDVLLLAHLDTSIPFKKQQNYRETEQRLCGTAIWGNKGGLATMILAFQALRFVRLLRNIKIGVLLTSDNALRGKFARDHVERIANRANVVIGLKGSSLDSSVVTSRSGAAIYTCQMNLAKAEKADHVAKAVTAFLRLLTGWAELTNEPEGVVVSPNDVDMKSNISDFFAQGEASLSVRYNHPE